ncbi:MAG: catalase family protein [Myxococcales bacterium]
MPSASPATDWKELPTPGEAERFEGYAKLLGEMQRQAADGGPRRALHAKGLLGARATFTVLEGLPAHARVGLFAAPGTHGAWVRFSNGMGRVRADGKGDVRGLAIKVLGVPGRKIIPGLEDATTQDFLLIQSPALAVRDADEFMFLVDAGRKPLTLLPRFIGRFGFGRTLKILGGLPKSFPSGVPSLAALQFWSPVPIQYGPYAARCSVRPVDPPAAPSGRRGGSYLGDGLAATLAVRPLAWTFLVQFYVDAVRTPIEDASIDWREDVSPFLEVARLELPQQDVRSPEGQRDAQLVEEMSFDPWHALVEHRPLGSMMRARGPAYRVSTEQRQAAPEPR